MSICWVGLLTRYAVTIRHYGRHRGLMDEHGRAPRTRSHRYALYSDLFTTETPLEYKQRVCPKVIRMVAELPATWGDARQGRVSADLGKTPDVTASPLSDAEMTMDDVAAEIAPSTEKDEPWLPSDSKEEDHAETGGYRNEQRRLKEQCLEREGHRCIVTGIWDRSAEHLCPPAERATHIGDTELAHIIPFSTAFY